MLSPELRKSVIRLLAEYHEDIVASSTYDIAISGWIGLEKYSDEDLMDELSAMELDEHVELINKCVAEMEMHALLKSSK